MSQHDPNILLLHMLDASGSEIAAAEGRARHDLDTYPVLRAALERFIMIIVEAAYQLSESESDAHPSIPWAAIIGTRHRLVHAYANIDPDILWNIVTLRLNELVPQVEAALQQRGFDPSNP